jgi:hypothetical protein
MNKHVYQDIIHHHLMNKYRVIGTKEKNTYVVDLIQSTCSCVQFYDKGSCKHLVACAYFADKPIMNVPLNNKFNIRYRQRKLVRKSYSNSEEDHLSPSTTSPVSVPVPSTTSPVSVPLPSITSPVSVPVPSITSPVSVKVPSTTSPVSVTVPSTTSPVPATSRVAVNRPMTRSQVNMVKGSNLIQTNSKVV